MRPLILACGNQLRGDDGAAWELARQLEIRGWPISLSHQWTPELVEVMVAHGQVVFADAALPGGVCELLELRPRGSVAAGHVALPAGLLQLCLDLYGRSPQAWLLSLPGEDFALGTRLSRQARRSIQWGRVALERAFGGGNETKTSAHHGSCGTRLP